MGATGVVFPALFSSMDRNQSLLLSYFLTFSPSYFITFLCAYALTFLLSYIITSLGS